MRVKELIKSPVTTCTTNTDVASARDLMIVKNIGALPVVQLTSGVVDLKGIVTYHDLVGVTDDDIRVQQVMTSTVKTIGEDSSLQEAAQLMIESRVHHLVVQDNKKIVGIISSLDFVKIIADQ